MAVHGARGWLPLPGPWAARAAPIPAGQACTHPCGVHVPHAVVQGARTRTLFLGALAVHLVLLARALVVVIGCELGLQPGGTGVTRGGRVRNRLSKTASLADGSPPARRPGGPPGAPHALTLTCWAISLAATSAAFLAAAAMSMASAAGASAGAAASSAAAGTSAGASSAGAAAGASSSAASAGGAASTGCSSAAGTGSVSAMVS